MKLNFERTGAVVVVTSLARVDGSNASAFEEALCEIVQDGDRALVIDFAPLKYIGSAGLRAILVTVGKLSARGAGFGICALPAPAQKIFSSIVHDLIPVYKTKEEAVAAFGG